VNEIAFEGTALGIEQDKLLKQKRALKEKNLQRKDYHGRKLRKLECKDGIQMQ